MHPKNLNFLKTHRWPLSPRSGCLTFGMLNPNIPPTKTDHKALFKGAAASVVISQKFHDSLLERESPKPLHSLAFMIGEAGAPTYAVPAGPPVPDPALLRVGGTGIFGEIIPKHWRIKWKIKWNMKWKLGNIQGLYRAVYSVQLQDEIGLHKPTRSMLGLLRCIQ